MIYTTYIYILNTANQPHSAPPNAQTVPKRRQKKYLYTGAEK